MGFYKTGSGRPSITWPQAVDGALCFGWIDGIRKGVDADSYCNRFTPRRAGSNWSAINIRRVKALEAEGLMHDAGREAFGKRKAAKSGIYSYENRHLAKLTPAMKRRFQENAKAWKFFRAQAPWYQRITTWYVVSAKQDATRERRLDRLITACAAGRSIDPLVKIRTGQPR